MYIFKMNIFEAFTLIATIEASNRKMVCQIIKIKMFAKGILMRI